MQEKRTLTHCGLMTPYGDIDLGQYGLGQWLVVFITFLYAQLVNTSLYSYFGPQYFVQGVCSTARTSRGRFSVEAGRFLSKQGVSTTIKHPPSCYNMMQIWLKFVANGPINITSASPPVMDWHRTCDRPLSEQWWPSSLAHRYITRPHRVNYMFGLVTYLCL